MDYIHSMDLFPASFIMSLIEDLNRKEQWNQFLEKKLENLYLSKKEEDELIKFVKEERYLPITEKLVSGEYEFSLPKKSEISKNGTDRKRIVYSYEDNEMIVLKMMSFLLYRYDHFFSSGLYSFRSGTGARGAVMKITHNMRIDFMYGYKADISDYFNSVDVDILIKDLKENIDDTGLTNLLENLLLQPYHIHGEEKCTGSRGVMAGVPLSAFLSNMYLRKLDEYFENKDCLYARYSDDIILFHEDKEKLEEYREYILSFIKEKGLKINPEKELFTEPGERFDFLGFSYHNGVIDLSKNTVKKTKAKIRRSARSIRRWMLKTGAPPEKAMFVMCRKYNRKFFGKGEGSLSWKYWFFPTINTDRSLHEIDQYFQENLRYIVTGKHTAKNYEAVSYEVLKSSGYQTLVKNYHDFKEM